MKVPQAFKGQTHPPLATAVREILVTDQQVLVIKNEVEDYFAGRSRMSAKNIDLPLNNENYTNYKRSDAFNRWLDQKFIEMWFRYDA